MNAAEQITEIDKRVAEIDALIAKNIGEKEALVNELLTLQAQIDRKTRYIQELGKKRSEIATFQLL